MRRDLDDVYFHNAPTGSGQVRYRSPVPLDAHLGTWPFELNPALRPIGFPRRHQFQKTLLAHGRPCWCRVVLQHLESARRRWSVWICAPLRVTPSRRTPSKEADFDRARVKNYERVEKLATQGHRFRNFLEQEGCWYWEVFGFLKGHSRVIALADYSVEKTFVLTVPHRLLLGDAETTSSPPNPGTPQRPVRTRRPRDCPF